jgi:hypothetical protein
MIAFYMDKNGAIWVKSGSDKRRATSREEIQRIFQANWLVHLVLLKPLLCKYIFSHADGLPVFVIHFAVEDKAVFLVET